MLILKEGSIMSLKIITAIILSIIVYFYIDISSLNKYTKDILRVIVIIFLIAFLIISVMQLKMSIISSLLENI